MDRGRLDRRGFLRATASAGAAAVFYAGGAGAAPEVTETDVRVASFDGAEIAATVFRPPGDGEHPVVLSTHGWGGDRGSVEGYARLAAANGYVALTWDQRGFGESDGEVGLSGPKEVQDVRTLIDFLAGDHPDADPQFTGRVDASGGGPSVGMIGASYGGGIQLNAAAVDDRIRALVPIVPWHDLTFSLAPNGVPKLGWTSLLYGSGVASARGGTSGDGQPTAEDLQRGVSPRLHEIYATTMARNELPPQGRSFLTVRSPAVKLDTVDAPALVVQGWPDTLFVPNEGQRIVEGLRGEGTEAKLVFFDGGHTATGDTAPADQVAYLEGKAVEWFDEHLKGEGESSLAPVTYYETQTADALRAEGESGASLAARAFTAADEFPPADATPETFAFDEATVSQAATATGSTTLVNSVAPTSASQISPQNGDFAAGVTSVDFDFTFEAATEVVGTPSLSLTVTPLGARSFVFAKLYHVTDAGATLLDNQATPLAVEGTPGTAQRVDLDLVSVQRFFDAGDSLRVTLATTDVGFTSARGAGGVQVDHAGTDLTVGTRPVPEGVPAVSVVATRSDDGQVFTGGETNQVDLSVDVSVERDGAAPPVLVRDRVPESWTLVGGDGERDGAHVVFEGRATSHDPTYFVEAPAALGDSNGYTFGPVAYSLDGGATWTDVGGSTDQNVVLGTEASGGDGAPEPPELPVPGLPGAGGDLPF
ncbi:CocE/NonD family hydrolase [Salinirubellus salinus]|uniref:CocE/NonD family hydrolase n=1 Tax=Salinirubellus salinus TaxID=1364945 RepID=A0A9E7U3X7_9EURY|nr:CocE/NonD family hydrolase [Salinirubellus salinus]UWM53685.1 CocE/NonD family hydrolase [Salinirubellus salinus]